MKNKNKFSFAMAMLFILLASALAQAADFSLEYRKNVTILPRSNQTLNIFVKNLVNEAISLNLVCESNLTISCPTKIELKANELKNLPIQVKTSTGLGIFTINFELNGEKGKIEVKVSNEPEALKDILDYYNLSLSWLEKEAGELEIPTLKQARVDLEIAHELYKRALYHETNEKLNQIRENIGKAAEYIAMEKIKEPERVEKLEWVEWLKILFLLIIIMLSILGLFHFLKKGKQTSFRGDLLKIKDIIGKAKRIEIKVSPKEKLDFKSLKKKIDSLRKVGKDTKELELAIKLAKKKYNKGLKNLAKRYLERIGDRIKEM
ncbi:MAG: hypothetical protein QMD36_05955 [Candidatus Aenigmarchaeota archaeon]|nr:hypothetical protein [Candidatus Aenigmarchaeota archaeon]